MKINLVFDDWRKEGKSIYGTSEGLTLFNQHFHSGATFKANIRLDSWQEKEFREALEKGFQPVFWVS